MDLALPNDFKEFLRLLNSYQVEYLLIVGYHGYPRAINDMDVWVTIHPDNAERLVNVMQAFGFSLPEVTTELFLQEQKIIRMGNPPMRIEILTSISGVSFTECYADRIVDEMDGVPVNVRVCWGCFLIVDKMSPQRTSTKPAKNSEASDKRRNHGTDRSVDARA